MAQRASSGLRAVDLRQSPPPLIIGERLSTQGSRRAKRLVMEDDIDGLVALAREQEADGAHCIDVCVATTELSNERDLMERLVRRLGAEVAAPLVIDSTEPDVIEAALRRYPGLPIINSINLEGDGSRFRALAPLMARYGAPAVAMCIGPDGMARSPGEKLAVARAMVEEGARYGLRPGQFVFDPLALTVATGDEDSRGAARDTLEGIRLIRRELPGSHTVVGLSNVSFGLGPAARRAVNSAFLYHAVAAGLDCAILNAREAAPYAGLGAEERRLAEDLIFDRSPGALQALIAHFEGAGPGAASPRAPDVDPSWPAGRRCRFRVENRLKDGVAADVAAAIEEKLGGPLDGADPGEAHGAAVRTLNEDLLPAMKEVGDRFGRGELILPFVLGSAECMKAAVSELERHLVRKEGASKGTLVLGTVYGDVHDIGKNLVRTIFENNGYTVHDLGKQVPLQRFLDKIAETSPDAVGLSALLVSTSKQMGAFVDRARRDGMRLPVLCGGAAVNSAFVARIATEGGLYEPGVFYCSTMFDGLRVMERLASGGADELLAEWRERLGRAAPAPRPAPAPAAGRGGGPPPQERPPRPPPGHAPPVRLGPADIPMGEVWELLDRGTLFRLSWGIRGRGARGVDPEALLDEWRRRAGEAGLIEPSVVYGMYGCSGRGGSLRVEHEGGPTEFSFPRAARGRRLCIADYFGPDDTVAFQAVTAGAAASRAIDRWNAEGRYSDAYYLHGLAVAAAEALAEWTHRRIRRELGIAGDAGLRYSWGYPSCPDVADHRKVWGILSPEGSGMGLTEAGQIVPEQSTAAIVVPHPGSEYFVVD